jgi:hypothetical protein
VKKRDCERGYVESDKQREIDRENKKDEISR